MHDGMQYDPIQGQGHEPFTVGNPAVFKSSTIYNGSWQLTTDSETTAKYINLIRPDFLIFGVVCVSRNFEIGTNVSCEESTISPRMGLILLKSK